MENDHLTKVLQKLNITIENIDIQDKKVIFDLINVYLNDVINYLKTITNEIEKPEELSVCLKLLNLILDFCIETKNESLFATNIDFNALNSLLLNTFENNNFFKTFISVEIFPKLSIFHSNNLDLLTNCLELKNIDALCVLFESEYDLKDFIEQESFINFLQKNLNTNHKQASYLLSQTLNFIFKWNLKNKYFTVDLPLENLKILWDSYFTLLDASLEKQLHLIEPTLKLLEDIKILHSIWRICLYKNFLNNSQNTVAFTVCTHLLGNKLEFEKMIFWIFKAINRNDYSNVALKFYHTLKQFCLDLDEKDFLIFLENFTEIAWNPTSLWLFSLNVFQLEGNLKIETCLFRKIIISIKTLPNVYVRIACLNLFLQSTSLISYNFRDFITIFEILDCMNEKLSICFIHKNRDSIENFLKVLTESEIEYNSLRFYFLCFENLELDNSILHNLRKFEELHLECIKNADDLENFLIFLQKTQISRNVDKLIEKIDDLNDIELGYLLFVANKTNNIDLFKKLRSFIFDKTTKNPFLIIHYLEFFVKNMDSVENLNEILEIIMDNYLTDLTIITFLCENLNLFIKKLIPTNLLLIKKIMEKLFGQMKEFNYNRVLVKNIINQIFSIDCLNGNYFNDIYSEICSELYKKDNYDINFLISKKIHELTCTHPGKCEIFEDIIKNFILNGYIVKKDERIEYCVYQDISKYDNYFKEENPNLKRTITRFLALDSMLNIIMGNKLKAGNFALFLMEKYKKYFNKRYFADSEIHLEKLRIIQILIILVPYLDDEIKKKLITLFLDSLLEENHQNSIKHLIQILLYNLLKSENEMEVLNLINDQLSKVSCTKPSSISVLLSVLYHLTLNSQNEEFWIKSFYLLSEYAMGPQFKLRLNAQQIMVELHGKACEMNKKCFLEKTEDLIKIVRKVFEASGANHEVYINLEVDHSTIFYGISKLHRVTHMEWENINGYQFVNLEFNHESTLESSVIENDPKTQSEPSGFIQRKITPWRTTEKLKTNNLILVTTLLDKPTNIGGLARTSEVFAIEKFVTKTSSVSKNKEFQSLSMSAENWIDIMEIKAENLPKFILDHKGAGYKVIGAEQTVGSIKLNEYKFDKKTVLILGNEKGGIPPHIISILDDCVEIPQLGVVRSLNVHVTGAIFIWEYNKQHSF